MARAIRYAVGRRHAEDVQQQLHVAEIQAKENARLERGLLPSKPATRKPSVSEKPARPTRASSM